MMNAINFDDLSVEQTLETLAVDRKQGLDDNSVRERLNKYGKNGLEDNKVPLWRKFLALYVGPIPFMIETALILSLILRHWPDFILILMLLLINSGLHFWQEFKADNAMEALKNTLALKARVLREGRWQNIDAKLLVPGDIVDIHLGNILPADVKLIAGKYLSIDQSALTGESLPVDKVSGDIAYSGTIAKLGSMLAVVIKTGADTFFGKTATLVTTASHKSHFQQAVLRIGNFLIGATLVVAIIILTASLYRMNVSHTLEASLSSLTIFILVVVVAGIPVALPAVLAVTMAIGASRLAKMKAIVTKLSAVEELAGIDILCTDKTGTLTKNKLTVHDVIAYANYHPADLLLVATLACDSQNRDAIDDAIWQKFQYHEKLKYYQQTSFTPFDPVIKRTEAQITGPSGSEFRVCKGAPQIILSLCTYDQNLQKWVQEKTDNLGSQGYRTLGVAQSALNRGWEFMGLLTLADPPRDDTHSTIEEIKDMAVDVKMITGDHVAIARQLSKQLGMGKDIREIDIILSSHASAAQRQKILEGADGFAQVFPEHKFTIVKDLQNQKHIVGMTGDGVNDAPALKQADVGIAVSGATDAARAAADIVLTEPGLSVITKAIEQSRCILGRMKSYAMYRISETLRLLLFLALSMIIYGQSPLTAIMIILIALLNDIPIMTIAYDNMRPEHHPVNWNMLEIIVIASGLAIVGVISTIVLYAIGDHYWFSQVIFSQKMMMLHTLAFMGILCGGNLTIYITRNRGYLWQKPLPAMKFFLATLFSQIVGTLISVYGLHSSAFIGIGWKYVIYAWIYIAAWFVICMLVKELLYIPLFGRLEMRQRGKENTLA